MAHARGLRLFDLEHCEELMVAKFEKGVAFTLVEFFEIKDILVKGHGLLDITHFDGDVITTIDFHAHGDLLSPVSFVTNGFEPSSVPRSHLRRLFSGPARVKKEFERVMILVLLHELKIDKPLGFRDRLALRKTAS